MDPKQTSEPPAGALGSPVIQSVRLSVYTTLRRLFRLFKYFFRFLTGHFDGLDRAPVGAKLALGLRRAKRTSSIQTSALPSANAVWKSCVSANKKLGVWPISFSYPEEAMPGHWESQGFLCPVLPGHKYSFSDPQAYLEMYQRYSFAMTHKKSGWDCFRHVEVLHAGTVPYLPDAHHIPEFTMVHYPKTFLMEIAHHLNRSHGYLESTARQQLTNYFNENLTSTAMAKYLLRAAGSVKEPKVLFLDKSAPILPDYQSVLTLIGLKQVLGRSVTVAHPIDYVYRDWAGDSTALYGRGFGYSRVLDPVVRNPNERNKSKIELTQASLERFDMIVIGSVTRNNASTSRLLDIFPASRTVWIHGEDQPPSREQMSDYRNSGATVFVRELGRH